VTSFTPTIKTYPGSIAEVQIGATRSEGGTRGKAVKVGGEKTLPFYSFELENPNRPVVAIDVFDAPVKLPRAIREYYEDVMDNPASWAEKCVKKFDADLVSIHLVSTDSKGLNRSAQEAAKTVEAILQAVDVPVIIGGSGDPKKDPEVLAKAAEASEGERCLIMSATLELYEPIAESAIAHGHNILAWTPVDVHMAKRLNRLLFGLGVPKNRLIMDPTTAALGYGLEYTFSVMERIRILALEGDEEVQVPMLCGISNAWGAREAWMKTPELGPAEFRGPLWEALTGVTLLMAGADVLLMVHPKAVKSVKDVISKLYSGEKLPMNILNWLK
jgi:acetyl-CoA decarbonylase/synthase complex subunit delta